VLTDSFLDLRTQELCTTKIMNENDLVFSQIGQQLQNDINNLLVVNYIFCCCIWRKQEIPKNCTIA